MATDPTKVEISKRTGKPKRKYSKRSNNGLPMVVKVKSEDNPLVVRMAQNLAAGKITEKELTIDQADRLSLYIHYYLTPKPDGSRRTKKEAALEAGYSEQTSDNVSCTIENNLGYARKMADYVNAWPRGDIRCDCVSVAQEILTEAEKPGERLAAARYLTEVIGEFAPKRVENASISLRGKLPERK